MTRREQILKLCEFKDNPNLSELANWGRDLENNKLKPIITAILEENEKLRGALETYRGFLGCRSKSQIVYDDMPKVEWGYYASQALAASDIDKLLEEK